jgi:hypothetical protein
MMSTRIEKKQLYDLHRPYYGYTISEWLEVKKDSIDIKHTKCTTCHRMKEIDNFISEHSHKQIKTCHFCQNRGFHKYHIDGGVNCRNQGGICNTYFVIKTNNHLIQHFRELDLSDLINENPIVKIHKQLTYERNKKRGQQRIICSCGVEINLKSLYGHNNSNRCIKKLEVIEKRKSEIINKWFAMACKLYDGDNVYIDSDSLYPNDGLI